MFINVLSIGKREDKWLEATGVHKISEMMYYNLSLYIVIKCIKYYED